jgi:HlyD family secretion protein
MKWRSRIGIGVTIAAVIVAVALGFRPAPVYVDVAAASRGPLQVTVEEEGKTRVIDHYVISAPVAAYARRIELDVGSAVRKGQPLVQLDPTPSAVLDPRSRAEAQARFEAAGDALSAAQQNARAAQATAELANTDLQRITRLRKDNLASADQEDRARASARSADAALRSAKFAVEVARHEQEAARTALQYSGVKETDNASAPLLITSPVDGNVLKRERQSEGVVSAGQALIEVGDPRSLEVEVEVLSADAVRIMPGMRVMFERWGGERPLQGVVRTVEPIGFTKISALGVEEQRVLVICDITSPNEQWQQLGDGYRVEASFILWREEDVLQIPASALFRHDDGWALFVMKNGRAYRREVKIGRRNGLIAQVVAGIAAGEEVITHPDDSIEDGVRVAMRR